MAKTTYSREELEHQLAESRREFRAADATIHNLELKLAEMAEQFANDESKCAALAGEVYDLKHPGTYLPSKRETPATDAFLAEVRAQGADECVRQLVTSDDDDFSDAPNICAMVAHQLRKGAQS